MVWCDGPQALPPRAFSELAVQMFQRMGPTVRREIGVSRIRVGRNSG